jgi:hypothetical protein
MLRVRSKGIYVVFIMLLMCLSVVSSHAQEPMILKQVYYYLEPTYYVVDAYRTTLHKIQNKRAQKVFTREAGIHSIAVWARWIYFCSTGQTGIYRIDMEERVPSEQICYQHWTYIRDIAFDRAGNLYFSEADGARGDGKIYKIERGKSPVDYLRREPVGPDEIAALQRYVTKLPPEYSISLSTVDGYWAGDFALDMHCNLYLSSGNRTPAFIYRVPRDKGLREEQGKADIYVPTERYGFPERVYQDTGGAIKGIAMDPDNPNFIYYANWNTTIYKVNLQHLGRSTAFVIPPLAPVNLSDVAFDMSPRQEK